MADSLPLPVDVRIARKSRRTTSLVPRPNRRRRGGADGGQWPPDESDEGSAIGTAYAMTRASECRHAIRNPDPATCSQCSEARGDIAPVGRVPDYVFRPEKPVGRTDRRKRTDDDDPLADSVPLDVVIADGDE